MDTKYVFTQNEVLQREGFRLLTKKFSQQYYDSRCVQERPLDKRSDKICG